MSLPILSDDRLLPQHQAVDAVTRALHQARLIHSCMTCEHFAEHAGHAPAEPDSDVLWPHDAAYCKLYYSHPPAKVIAYGCPSWTDGLPF